MNEHEPPSRHRRMIADRPGLRLLVLLTMVAGVLAVAAAAFVFSYPAVRDLARNADVSSGLARYYPALPDAAIVVAVSAALALRGARWWTRAFAWLSILVLTAAVGAACAVHAMAIKLPRRPTAATVAVAPWAMLLLGFRLWFSVLRNPPPRGASAGAGQFDPDFEPGYAAGVSPDADVTPWSDTASQGDGAPWYHTDPEPGPDEWPGATLEPGPGHQARRTPDPGTGGWSEAVIEPGPPAATDRSARPGADLRHWPAPGTAARPGAASNPDTAPALDLASEPGTTSRPASAPQSDAAPQSGTVSESTAVPPRDTAESAATGDTASGAQRAATADVGAGAADSTGPGTGGAGAGGADSTGAGTGGAGAGGADSTGAGTGGAGTGGGQVAPAGQTAEFQRMRSTPVPPGDDDPQPLRGRGT
jgi:hypothetical protein